MGRRYQNRGEVLLGYGPVCFAAFKYQHRLAKTLTAPLTECNSNYKIRMYVVLFTFVNVCFIEAFDVC